MNNRGQMALGEVILICIILMAVVGFVLWRETGKRTESNAYENGANHYEYHETTYSLLGIPRCGKLFSIESGTDKPINKEKR